MPGSILAGWTEVEDTSVTWTVAVKVGSSGQPAGVQTGGVAIGLLLAEEPVPCEQRLAHRSQECTLASCCHCHRWEGAGRCWQIPSEALGPWPYLAESAAARCPAQLGHSWVGGMPLPPAALFLPGSPHLCRCQGPGAYVTVTELPTGNREP